MRNELRCILILYIYIIEKEVYRHFLIECHIFKEKTESLFIFMTTPGRVIIQFMKERYCARNARFASAAANRSDAFEAVIQKSPERSRLPVDASSGAAALQRSPVNGKQTRGFGTERPSDWQTSVSTRATDEKNFQLADAPAASRNVTRARRQRDNAPPFFAVAPKKETEINYFRRQRQIRSCRDDRSPA